MRLLSVKNIDLLLKLKRNNKNNVFVITKNILGKSIKDRPKYIVNREEFEHWEIDIVIGSRRKNEPAIITLTVRITKVEHIIKISEKSIKAVDEDISKLLELYGDTFKKVLKQ